MTQLPLVTLTMPVYNVSKFVEKSLLSALNQTYRNIEFLIVDDCSTDNSMDIVRQTVNAHKRSADVRIIHHPGNQGLGDTRNTAIKEAKGEYIYFMDSDDIISSCCIEVLVNYMLENPVDFIAASRERRTFDGKLISTDQYQPYTVKDDHRSTLPVAYFRYVENHKILAEVWNKLYNVDFLRKNKIRCIPHVHVEDVSFSLQVNIAAKSCRLVPDVLYVYHIYEGQSFAAFNNNHERALYLADCFVKIRKYDADIVSCYSNCEEYAALIAGVYNVTLLHSQMIVKSSVLSKKEKQNFLNLLWKVNYSLSDILRFKHKAKYALCYWGMSCLPISIKYSLIKGI